MKSNKNYNVITKAEETYLTPPEIFESLEYEDFCFDLDPACPPDMPWKTAKRMLTKAEDGLAAEWKGHVWLNPPYGAETKKWTAKMAEHNDGIALVFNRTDTGWFHDAVLSKARAMFLLRGRIRFYNQDGTQTSASAPAPSVLIAYGDEAAVALYRAAAFKLINGHFIFFS
ncbi:MAG: hypothetical protein IKW49_01585 [Opitutales bacterium]|nr:hypothetical protein [Opitutales bacterium]